MEKENLTTTLTDEQINEIAEQLDEEIKGTVLEDIKNFPSNNGVEYHTPEQGEAKIMQVSIDPNTGEHRILGGVDEYPEDIETFEEMCERLENTKFPEELEEITEEELVSYIDKESKNKDSDRSMLTGICSLEDISEESITSLIKIVNRKIKGEEFNIYKAFPEDIRKIVDKYLTSVGAVGNSNQVKQFRNMISESLISEFITNISLDKMQNDFNKEVEELFTKGSAQLAESIVGYTAERNKAYRDYAGTIDDEEKKVKINNILDQIDEGYNLNTLKEFAKKCKIKKFDLEKPGKIFENFHHKYVDSPYNIYSIEVVRPILYRNLNPGEKEEFTAKDIDAFFIAFCKQTMNMKPDVVTDHAYMYYVIYNITLMDMNKGESKEVSEKFAENIKEVIYNLRSRNNY